MTLDLKSSLLTNSTLTTCETFHTANSSCSFDTINDLKSLPSDSNLLSLSANIDSSTPCSNKMISSGYGEGRVSSVGTDSDIGENNTNIQRLPKFKNKNLPSLDDSDEMSSTEDYIKVNSFF